MLLNIKEVLKPVISNFKDLLKSNDAEHESKNTDKKKFDEEQTKESKFMASALGAAYFCTVVISAISKFEPSQTMDPIKKFVGGLPHIVQRIKNFIHDLDLQVRDPIPKDPEGFKQEDPLKLDYAGNLNNSTPEEII